jgi:hypothetical protein
VIAKRLMAKPGGKVVLTALPDGFIDDLPDEDQKSILAIVGKPVRFTGYDDDRMELEFAESNGTVHFIYVDRKFVATAKKSPEN